MVMHIQFRESSDQGGITNLIGEYRSRCLFSRTWALREAVINKVHLMLQPEFIRDPPGLTSTLPALCQILRVGVEDKIQQVLFATISLLEDILKASRGYVLLFSCILVLF